jgi:hypothetical protein
LNRESSSHGLARSSDVGCIALTAPPQAPQEKLLEAPSPKPQQSSTAAPQQSSTRWQCSSGVKSARAAMFELKGLSADSKTGGCVSDSWATAFARADPAPNKLIVNIGVNKVSVADAVACFAALYGLPAVRVRMLERGWLECSCVAGHLCARHGLWLDTCALATVCGWTLVRSPRSVAGHLCARHGLQLPSPACLRSGLEHRCVHATLDA